MAKKVFVYKDTFSLESGASLAGFELAYQTWGERNADDTNIVWVCHALTANADAEDWWPGMLGAGRLLDPSRDYIICANMLGSCYGSTNALSMEPSRGEPYYHRFPMLTNRDIVRGFEALRKALNIKKIKLILGGSMGGQHALEWAIMQPELFEYLVPIATNAQHSPWGIAFNETQRMAIQADASWQTSTASAGMQGMRVARAAALLSYRGYATYQQTQAEEKEDILDDFRAASYQRYQGEKLARRFHAYAYWSLSKAMDSQHVGRMRGGIKKALGKIKAQSLVIGVSSDILFPVEEQRQIADGIRQSVIKVVDSPYGHDGFLIEVEAISQEIRQFLTSFN